MRRPMRHRLISTLIGACFALTSAAPGGALGAPMGDMMMASTSTPGGLTSSAGRSMDESMVTTASVASASATGPHADGSQVPCGHHGTSHCCCCTCCMGCESIVIALDAGRVVELPDDAPRACDTVAPETPAAVPPARVDAVHPFAIGPPVGLHA